MEAVRETTKWEGDLQPNHIYLFDGSKAVAYIKKGTDQPYYFKNPMQIDRRGRTFEPVEPNPFKAQAKSHVVRVAGSKGNFYEVDPDAKTCTCPGFQFRGNCKHLVDILAK